MTKIRVTVSTLTLEGGVMIWEQVKTFPSGKEAGYYVMRMAAIYQSAFEWWI